MQVTQLSAVFAASFGMEAGFIQVSAPAVDTYEQVKHLTAPSTVNK